MDEHGIALRAISGPAPAAGRERLREAAGALEGEFIRLFLSAMRRTVPRSGIFGGTSPGQRVWEDLMDRELAESAGRRSMLGLAGAVVKALSPRESSPVATETGASRFMALDPRPHVPSAPRTAPAPRPAAPLTDPAEARAEAASGARQRLGSGLLARLKIHDGPVVRAARELGLEPNLVRAVMTAESGARKLARSPRGALGLMQLMPGTARELGVKNPWDPDENLKAGARYLKSLIDRFGGDLELALAGYNAGPANVERYGRVPPFAETRGFIRRVLEFRELLGQVFPDG